MIHLFAGIGPQGEMRFIGEVERGAACACRCPECDSPLIAKQGNEKEWHFAHESGQERPECHAGAINMLRRLAIEHLSKREDLRLPMYQTCVRSTSPGIERTETVEWNAQLKGALTWLPKSTRSAPVAIGTLDSGVDAHLYVEIGDPYPARTGQAAGMAAIDFVCAVPPLSDLRKRVQAERQIEVYGRLQWRYHPDTFGLAAAAQGRVNASAAKFMSMVKQISQRRASEEQERLLAQQRPFDASAPAAAPANVEPQYSWAPLRKPSAAFIFYRLQDGSAWVVYEMVDATMAIAPWPKADGWDKALPPSVGVADEPLGVYRGTGQIAVMTFFGPRTVRTFATRDPEEFEGR
jgi:hypothetical protein